MTTIKDVASLAGVSNATVSRIINNDLTCHVTDETRSRVWDAAIKLGYWPRPVSKRRAQLSAQASVTLACIFSVTMERYSDPFFTDVLVGAEARILRENYSISILRTYNELCNKNILHATFNQHIDGLLLMEEIPDDMLQYIKQRVPHIVGVDTYYDQLDNVSFNRRGAAVQAMRRLLERGHRRIAFIGGSGREQPLSNSDRFGGYCDCLREAGIPIDETLIKNCYWQQPLAHQFTNQLLALPDRPTAIFAASDLTAIAALSAIYESGLKVPSDIAIVGVNNIGMTAFTSPPLTTIDVHAREIGEIAADILLSRINGDVSARKNVILQTRLIDRSSV